MTNEIVKLGASLADFEKWTLDQEKKGKDWKGKLNRESQLQEKGLGSRVVGFHCPWCRYRTLYYKLSDPGMHCLTCGLEWTIECTNPEVLDQLKKDRKLESKFVKGE